MNLEEDNDDNIALNVVAERGRERVVGRLRVQLTSSRGGPGRHQCRLPRCVLHNIAYLQRRPQGIPGHVSESWVSKLSFSGV